MRDLLALGGRRALASIDPSRTLFAFDFDGTLAAIVDDPHAALISSTTRALLATLSQRWTCAIVSGRGRDDVLSRIAGIGPIAVIGNHGIEDEQLAALGPSDPLLPRICDWRSTLSARCASLEGVWIEDKRHSLAIHYRQARRKKTTREAIALAAAELSGVRLVPGKHVWNVVPDGARHKGDAVRALLQAHHLERLFFIGDDDTDEDVFRLAPEIPGIYARVGRRTASKAGWFISRQARIDELLALLLRQPALPAGLLESAQRQ